MPRASGGRMPLGTVLRLARADLAHEWVLTMCLVLAIAAVLSPLLLLFGLKFGTIETLRSRLIQDPRNREIRPMTSRSFDHQWFAELARRADVAFVIPSTRQIAATVDATAATPDGPRVTLDVAPTAPGDPLLAENGAPVPGKGQCVLSHLAAEALGAKIGDGITFTAKRLRGAAYENATVRLTLTGVLDPRATALKTVYLPLTLLEAIENYKDGQAVPELGWPGDAPEAFPVYDGVVVAVPAPLDKLAEIRLINGTGFSQIEKLSPAQLAQTAGYGLDPGLTVYLVRTRKTPVGLEGVLALKDRLRGAGAFLLPWVGEVAARLVDAQGNEIARFGLLALGPTLDGPAPPGLAPAPPWPAADQGPPPTTLMLPAAGGRPGGQVFLELTGPRQGPRFPVTLAETKAPGDKAFTPPKLAGVLRLAAQRQVDYDQRAGRFLLARRGYASFRLYAAGIDDVEGLRKHFDKAGIAVNTEAQRIRDVTQLDQYLGLIFWLIAVVGLAGGAAALTASLYASVERKQKELSVLRLLGLPAWALIRFPLYQGVIIAALGFAVALGVFQALAWVINRLFQAHLQSAESLCRLPAAQAVASFGGVLLLAVLASAAAGWRATRIDPAEALRDE